MEYQKFLKAGRYDDLSIRGIDGAIVLRLYKSMMRLRRCQESLIEEYHPADEMRCPIHFCIGQEAVSAALSELLEKDDYLLSHHRSHGYYLAKGASMRSLFAEIYGRETGANGGLAGSQDISMHDLNFCSGAILTGAVAIAAGVGLAYRLQGKRSVAVSGFGDGATDEGVFWEATNYAALHKLPVVFICENNGYATYSPQMKRQALDNISEKVSAFGVKVKTIFGNDVIKVYSAIDEAITYARSGNGPYFIEAYTYRFNPHVGPEDDDYLGYRSSDELKLWKDNCPISLLEEQMIIHNLLSVDSREKIINEIDAEIRDAFEFAKKSSFPSVKDLTKLNYSSCSPMADKLLVDAEPNNFNQNQKDAIPGPY